MTNKEFAELRRHFRDRCFEMLYGSAFPRNLLTNCDIKEMLQFFKVKTYLIFEGLAEVTVVVPFFKYLFKKRKIEKHFRLYGIVGIRYSLKRGSLFGKEFKGGKSAKKKET